MGIHMLPTKDDWLTPWHGTAVEVDGTFLLMKKTEAVELNAEPSGWMASTATTRWTRESPSHTREPPPASERSPSDFGNPLWKTHALSRPAFTPPLVY